MFAVSCKKDEPPVLYTRSDEILSVKGVGYISGRLMEGYDESWCVLGTDLGHTIYDATDDTLYFAHGDTFSSEYLGCAALWRSNVLAYKKNASEWNLAEEPYIDGYISNNGLGIASAIIEGKHGADDTMFEVTKIPRGGVAINGVLYIWYMSVASWSPWVNNYSGVVKSTDKGQTWERVYDLTWVASATKRSDVVHKLATETVEGTESGVTLDLTEREAPNFVQMYPVDGKDGYVYLFGTSEGTQNTAKLTRVSYENIENFQKYEYFIGLDKNGNAIWKAGTQGLNEIKSPPKGAVLFYDGGNRNLSMGEAGGIYWNNYLNKWIMSYHYGNSQIAYRTSECLWTGWSEAKTILDRDDYPFPEGAERTYGGFSHEVMSADGGKKIYIVVSTWEPYNCYLMEVEFV